MSPVERVLWYLNFLAELVLLGQLLRCKLAATYRALFLYWLVQALMILVMLPVPLMTDLYTRMYWGSQTINIVMAVFVVQDLYRIALSERPALASFGRSSVLIVMAVAAAAASPGIFLDSKILPGQLWDIHRFATFERSMNFVILMFLLVISGFLLWFPIKVRRNIVVYISGFVLFSASRSLGLLLANLLPQQSTRLISTVLLGLTFLCLLIWMVGIRPEGERVTATPGYRRDPEATLRLNRQLDAINAALSRLGRG